MKKHYIRIAIIIDVLILLVCFMAVGFYTYILAEDEVKMDMSQAYAANYLNMPEYKDDMSEEELIMNSFCSYWDRYDFVHYKGTGYYGYLKLNDGTVFDTSRDYVYLQLDEGDAHLMDNEIRILFIDDDTFDEQGHLFDPDLTAECDDIFVHGGKMDYQNNSYQIGDIGYRSGETTTVEEWSRGLYILGTAVRMADDDREAKLNKDAQNLFEELYEKMNNGESVEMESDNIFIAYYLDISVVPAGQYFVIQVFHPVEHVINAHKGFYIFMCFILIVVEVIVAVVISRLYKNRKESEARSRRLTRGVAHELKTPLAVTKAYMDNWDDMDDAEKSEYARKINHEVDDMTNLINAMLEMDKINSGSVKLNLEEIDLVSLILSVYNRIRPLAEERSLDVKMPEDEECVIKADLKFLKIALGNYLTNMVKYADKHAEVRFSHSGRSVRVIFKNDSTNDKMNKTDKINSNGMGVEINENIMKIHGFKYGSNMKGNETIFWFEAAKI